MSKIQTEVTGASEDKTKCLNNKREKKKKEANPWKSQILKLSNHSNCEQYIQK